MQKNLGTQSNVPTTLPAGSFGGASLTDYTPHYSLRAPDLTWLAGWETGTGLKHLVSFGPETDPAARTMRIFCHLLVDELPDSEMNDLAAELMDKASIYLEPHHKYRATVADVAPERPPTAVFGPLLSAG